MADKSARKYNDLLLISAVLLVAAGLLLMLTLWSRSGEAVEVTVDGKAVATLPLGTDATLTVDGIGGQNTLVIADGKASVTAATCPDKVCARHRAVSRTGERILCLPHRVIITVVGGTPAVDAEVGG